MGTRNSNWWLVSLQVSRDAEETASALLFDLGTTGIVTLEESPNSLKLGAYFSEQNCAQDIKDAVDAEFTRAGLQDVISGLSVTSVPEQDWMQKWKEGFEAIAVGLRMVVAPSWKVPEVSEGQVVIQIDPGMAFGTGSHDTTRLCLEAIERYWKGGSLLDVGTGTGILAIAAALLKPGQRVVAIDVDPQAVEVARENLIINGVQGSIELHQSQPRDFTGGAFDLVVANLTAEVIIGLTADLIGCLGDHGLTILSGILTELAEDVEASLSAWGLAVIDRRQAGEWSVVVAQRASS